MGVFHLIHVPVPSRPRTHHAVEEKEEDKEEEMEKEEKKEEKRRRLFERGYYIWKGWCFMSVFERVCYERVWEGWCVMKVFQRVYDRVGSAGV